MRRRPCSPVKTTGRGGEERGLQLACTGWGPFPGWQMGHFDSMETGKVYLHVLE